jgi:hypothetical protein
MTTAEPSRPLLKMTETAPQSPLVPLKKFRPLLELLQPLDETEANKLRDYMWALLDDRKAIHMRLERFYCYASAIESMAYSRSKDTGDQARKVIYKIISETGRGDSGLQGSPVPAGHGPGNGPKSTSAEAAPQPADPAD